MAQRTDRKLTKERTQKARAKGRATKRRSSKRIDGAGLLATTHASPPNELVDFIVQELMIELARLLRACGYSEPSIRDRSLSGEQSVRSGLFPFKGHLAFGMVPAGRILQLWHCDTRFLDDAGMPVALPMTGPNSFETLIKLADCKQDPKAVAATLVNAKFVKSAGSTVRPIVRAALSSGRGKVGQVLLCLGDLVRTLEHNMTDGMDPSKALFQRFASDTAVPASRVEEFKEHFSKQAMALLYKTEEWLLRAEREAAGREELHRVNVHVFLSPFEIVPVNGSATPPT